MAVSVPLVGSPGWLTWPGLVPPVEIIRRRPQEWAVKLLPRAVMMAERVAGERQRQNAERGRAERNRSQARDGLAQLQDHRVGAYGEVAVAGVVGIVYRGPVVRPLRVPDIGLVHVKTARPPAGHLIIQADEEDVICPFLLCTAEHMCGRPVTIVMRGWIYGYAAPPPSDPYRTGRPARWIPQSRLRPLDELFKVPAI